MVSKYSSKMDQYRAEADAIVSENGQYVKDVINRLLELDARIYCYMGIDTSKTERNEAKLTSRYIYRLIKQYNYEKGERLLNDYLKD
jgi:hypothetical protein